MKQIDYPVSPSLIKQFHISSFIGHTPTVSSNDDILRIRANRALDLLFEVASEIGQKAVDADHRPLIIIDEVFDLIRKDRFADVRGDELLDRICTWTVRHNIDKKDVNVFMAASSCFLLRALGSRRLHGINRQTVVIKDPSEIDITEYLENKLGYSPAACKRVIECLGCRLRHLSVVLAVKLSDEELDTYINQCHAAAINDIRDIFLVCSNRDSRLQVIKILDDLSREGTPAIIDYSALPLEIQNHHSFKVFYHNEFMKIVIQSVPLRNAWLAIKNEIVSLN